MLDRIFLRLERFLWFALAAAVGGTWVFYEPLTGREVPGHAHPVFAALVAAALTFGGIDLRKVARIRRELEGVAREAGVDPTDLTGAAVRIAALEVEDPQVVALLRSMARREPTRERRRPKSEPGELAGENGGTVPGMRTTQPRPRTNRRNRPPAAGGES